MNLLIKFTDSILILFDIFNGKEEFNDIKTENKGYLHDIPSENSSVQPLNKVSIKLLILIIEGITRKKLGGKGMEIVIICGWVFLAFVFALTMWNDLARVFGL